MSKRFAQFLSERIARWRRRCKRANILKNQVFPYWDFSTRRYIYNLVTKEKYSEKLDWSTLATTLQNMQAHATMHVVSPIAIPKIGCGFDQMNWQDVLKLLRKIFAHSDIQSVVYSLDEHAIHAMSTEGGPEFYAEDEKGRYSEEFHFNERGLETDFTSDAKSCQLACDKQFPNLRPKEQNEPFIENYLQYQPKELVKYIKVWFPIYRHHWQWNDPPHWYADWLEWCVFPPQIWCRKNPTEISRYIQTECRVETSASE